MGLLCYFCEDAIMDEVYHGEMCIEKICKIFVVVLVFGGLALLSAAVMSLAAGGCTVQLAAILYRYGAYKQYDVKQCGTLEKFLDAHKIEPYAKANMRWALGAGIITGRMADALEPQGQCTRAEVSVMLQRFMEKYGK